ncbi:RNA-binding domain-containing protein [Oscillatoria sp. FACHB-1406]|uniref:RNA-binding domain-containing protein n=1 Tax=Oscillatoria sp. FACHB-1406 TaxID=2692846 RepID=UPI0016834557|nr:RNA-binding domain-containing protein [Oscillatoria sp. FACHB-1406]MBD2578063.1 putative DNA binding domain-containing protein [Oscillatoria sp. FACHB-1406]
MDREFLLEQLSIGENEELECKASQEHLSKDVWETVSAFANTEGGYIILGISEKKGKFAISGVDNPEKQQKEFWDNHNNPRKLNVPICKSSDVTVETIDEHLLIVIRVPKATRTQRPVYINQNPLTGTYKRNYEGDYLCTQDEVRQMLRDASSEPQDYGILKNFSLNDLDPETLKAFRQRFRSREPDHPWLAGDDQNLLFQLGGWRCDRNTGEQGLTLAGLLMFGRERSITDAFPNYHLDYQEKFSDNPEQRWTHRITLDGKWEANLFNFYYRVYGRLTQDLDVPFQLDRDAIRKGETHVHEALREALANTIIHADYLSTRPIQVTKFRDRFLFANPGRLRIPLESLYEGGLSDARNPNLQKMFQMLGIGDKAGSGFPKILRAWREQQWFTPLVSEKLNVNLITVSLPTVSLIPEEIDKELRSIVGEKYRYLSELDRMILVLAHRLGDINNTDIQCYSKQHPRDIGDRLKDLVESGCLQKYGHGRGTYYSLPDTASSNLLSLIQLPVSSSLNSDRLTESSDRLTESSDRLTESSDRLEQLKAVAEPVRSKGKVNPKQMQDAILKVCQDAFLTQQQLAEVLDRSPHTLRRRYLQDLVKKGLLELRYPDKLTHPAQAYRTKRDSE